MRQVYNVESPPSSMLFDTSSIEAYGSGATGMDSIQSLAQFEQHVEQLELKPQLRQAYPTRLTLANLIPSRFAFHSRFFICMYCSCFCHPLCMHFPLLKLFLCSSSDGFRCSATSFFIIICCFTRLLYVCFRPCALFSVYFLTFPSST